MMLSAVKFIVDLNIVSVITERILDATLKDPLFIAIRLAILSIDFTGSLTRASYKGLRSINQQN